MSKTSKYTTTAIANWFLLKTDEDLGDVLTNLKLQKLLYYSQAWHLVFFDCPLFDEDFEAWTYGPVLPSVYHKYKKYKYNLPIPNQGVEIDLETEKLLCDVMNVYGEKSAKYLVELTHSEKPWIETRHGLPLESVCTQIISKELIKDFYTQLHDETKEE